ncbi:MAG: ABC transporter permease [Bacillota bacterium]
MRASLRIGWRVAMGRRRRLAILALIVAVGVGGLVAVQSVVADLQAQIDLQARSLLGADLEIALPAEPEGDQRGAIGAIGPSGGALQEVGVASLVAQAGERRALVQVRGVDPDRYPWYGRPELQPAGPLAELLPPGGAVVSASLAAQLGLSVGQHLTLGESELQVTAILERDPQAAANNPLAGPPVLVRRESLPSLAPGHQRLALVRLPEGGAGAELQRRLAAAFGSRLRDYAQVAEEAQTGVARTSSALSLMAVIALVLGALCVASTIRAFVVESTDEVAMWKVLGMEPGQVLAIFAVQLLLATGGGSLLGVAVGLGLRAGVARLLAGKLPVALAGTALSLLPVLGGVLVGIGICLLAAWPALASLQQILPARILRPSGEAQEEARIPPGVVALSLAGVLCLIVGLSGSVGTGLPFVLGLFVVTAVLWGVSRLVLLLLQSLPLPWHPWQLARRNLRQKGALTAVVALSVGTFLMAGLGLLQGSVISQLRAGGGTELLPNLYLLQVPGREKLEVQSFLKAQGGSTALPSFAVSSARLEGPGTAQRSALVLEATDFVPIQVVEGEGLPARAGGRPALLVRRKEAGVWGLHPGDTVRLTVDSRQEEYRVAGIWEKAPKKGWSIQVDAPLIVAPGMLGPDAPHVLPVRVDPAAILAVQGEVAARYPGILPVSLDDLFRTVESMLQASVTILRYISSLALLTGAVALVGALAATQLQKRRETAILKVLGFSQAQVVSSQLLENFALGFASSLAGALFALGLVSLLAALLTGTGPGGGLVLQTLLGWPVLSGGLAALAGLITLAGVFRHSPLETLRAEG